MAFGGSSMGFTGDFLGAHDLGGFLKDVLIILEDVSRCFEDKG